MEPLLRWRRAAALEEPSGRARRALAADKAPARTGMTWGARSTHAVSPASHRLPRVETELGLQAVPPSSEVMIAIVRREPPWMTLAIKSSTRAG